MKGNSHFQTLFNKWTDKHEQARKKIEKKHNEIVDFILDIIPQKEKIAAGAAGLILLSNNLNSAVAMAHASTGDPTSVVEESPLLRLESLKKDLQINLPTEMRALSDVEEASVSAVLSERFSLKVTPSVNGLRLNRSYGKIGAEQHLARFPGDTMSSHFTSDNEASMFHSSGMAPGRGAWGYFAPSGGEMTVTDIEREKWYIAVQTFLAPDYNTRLREYRDFFKYRKMLVVNPLSGQAVVTDIADAGPAVWTGKHLGGSPEVMYFLGLHQGPRKGAVLYFFIDDPDDTIPLGPISPK